MDDENLAFWNVLNLRRKLKNRVLVQFPQRKEKRSTGIRWTLNTGALAACEPPIGKPFLA